MTMSDIHECTEDIIPVSEQGKTIRLMHAEPRQALIRIYLEI